MGKEGKGNVKAALLATDPHAAMVTSPSLSETTKHSLNRSLVCDSGRKVDEGVREVRRRSIAKGGRNTGIESERSNTKRKKKGAYKKSILMCSKSPSEQRRGPDLRVAAYDACNAEKRASRVEAHLGHQPNMLGQTISVSSAREFRVQRRPSLVMGEKGKRDQA